MTSVIPGYVVLEQVILREDVKIVVLEKEVNDIEQRITAVSESLAEEMQKKQPENADDIRKNRGQILTIWLADGG